MNILIMTENFTKGGLETHIATYYKELKKSNNIYFAIGNYEDHGFLIDAKIETGFHFNYDVTIGDFISDVNRLVKIIEDNEIEVIHVHPFYSIYQAIFAAQLTKTKLVYTYHGLGSLTFTINLFDEIMLEYALETAVLSIFSVSQRGVDVCKRVFTRDIALIPNPIDDKLYKKTEIKNNKKWALVSRLDIDKSVTIENIIKNLDQLDIEELDVWGDGTQKNNLENIAKGIGKKVNFMGHSSDLNNELLDKYNGVIGIGRVAIEGLAMGYPVILAGNDKNCGVIDREFYEKAKIDNFTAISFNEKSINEINMQLSDLYNNTSKYDFRNEIISEFGVENVVDQYVNHLRCIPEQVQNINTVNLFKDLSLYDSNARFHDDNNLSDLLNKYIFPYVLNIFIKNKIMILNNLNKQNNESIARFNDIYMKCEQNKLLAEKNEILVEKNKLLVEQSEEVIKKNIALMEKRLKENESLINDLSSCNNKLEYRLNYLSNNINSKTIIRNNIRKILAIFQKKNK